MEREKERWIEEEEVVVERTLKGNLSSSKCRKEKRNKATCDDDGD